MAESVNQQLLSAVTEGHHSRSNNTAAIIAGEATTSTQNTSNINIKTTTRQSRTRNKIIYKKSNNNKTKNNKSKIEIPVNSVDKVETLKLRHQRSVSSTTKQKQKSEKQLSLEQQQEQLLSSYLNQKNLRQVSGSNNNRCDSLSPISVDSCQKYNSSINNNNKNLKDTTTTAHEDRNLSSPTTRSKAAELYKKSSSTINKNLKNRLERKRRFVDQPSLSETEEQLQSKKTCESTTKKDKQNKNNNKTSSENLSLNNLNLSIVSTTLTSTKRKSKNTTKSRSSSRNRSTTKQRTDTNNIETTLTDFNETNSVDCIANRTRSKTASPDQKKQQGVIISYVLKLFVNNHPLKIY